VDCPRVGVLGKVKNICKHSFGIRREMEVFCREITDSIVGYYRF
jgi:hypothetical protein